MYSIWYDLSVIVPEINLILGSLLFLLFGVFSKANTLRYVCYGGVVLIIVSIYQLGVNIVRDTTLFNGMLVINEYISLIKVMLLLGGIVILVMLSTLKDTDQYLTFEMPILMMLSIVGMMFLISSDNLLSFYLSLELMSLPLYIMAAYNRGSDLSSEAGLKYFILGVFASGLYLFGASLLFGFTGTGDLEFISQYFAYRTSGTEDVTVISSGILLGLILMIIAICFKISAAPFHMWTPDVYQGSPAIVTAFFASLPKVAMLAFLARIIYGPFELLASNLEQILIFISVLSMIVGSLGGIIQKNIKRLLAYSSIAHVGFALIGIAIDEEEGLKALVFYITIYLTIILGVFSCLLMLKKNKKSEEFKENISDLSGLAKRYPYLAFAIAIMMLSLTGIPPFAGFFAKFYVIYASFKKGMYVYSTVALLTSVIAAYYYLKVIKVMYFDEGRAVIGGFFPLPLKIISAIMVAINILYLIFPIPFMMFSDYAAIGILGLVNG